MTKANTLTKLPPAKSRAVRGGPEVREIRVRLEVVTPIFGGGYQSRTIDNVDVIRAPSVRAHLRFWWRALYASQYECTRELYQRESALWGRAATDYGGRSAVEVRVKVDEQHVGKRDPTDVQGAAGAYALWPARAETKSNTPAAPRRLPGTQFQLTLKVSGGDKEEAHVRNALRAWILFGGYGGRTRRGLGSLRVIDDARGWQPAEASRQAITELFGIDIFAPSARAPGDVPSFAGAGIHVKCLRSDARNAWITALGWLQDFRQGTNGNGPVGDGARKPGAGNRPSISNWPEADKIRHFRRKTKDHKPNHNAIPAWPRAGFGLPIIGRFQDKRRNGGRYDEPGAFELRAVGIDHDRFASPLIVKALPLADGTFRPCALWLNRDYPANAQVGLVEQGGVDPRTLAPIDRLVAPGDTARFSALADKTSLRHAFLDWLLSKHETTVVAP